MQLRRDSNPQPLDSKSNALSSCATESAPHVILITADHHHNLRPHISCWLPRWKMKKRGISLDWGLAGIEPATSRTLNENHTTRPQTRHDMWCGSDQIMLRRAEGGIEPLSFHTPTDLKSALLTRRDHPRSSSRSDQIQLITTTPVRFELTRVEPIRFLI